MLNIYVYASRIAYRLLLSNQARSTNAYELVNCKLNYTQSRVESHKSETNDRPEGAQIRAGTHRFQPRCWLMSLVTDTDHECSHTGETLLSGQSKQDDGSLRNEDDVESSPFLYVIYPRRQHSVWRVTRMCDIMRRTRVTPHLVASVTKFESELRTHRHFLCRKLKFTT